MEKEEMQTFCKISRTAIIGTVIKTPLGPYSIKACGGGSHSVNRVISQGTDFKPDMRVDVLKSNPEWADVELKKGDEVSDPEVMIRRIVKWFHCYFNDPLTLKQNFPKSVEICVTSGTPFQREIWKALQEGVEFGNTLSYGELAAVVNKPNAARGVGTAMRLNPNCLIVPCHRVVRANSVIGNYSGGGSEVKEWLLNHEKNNGGRK